ncbi:unnamed protein product, partial [marine sediment metagenome]
MAYRGCASMKECIAKYGELACWGSGPGEPEEDLPGEEEEPWEPFEES